MVWLIGNRREGVFSRVKKELCFILKIKRTVFIV